MHRQLWFPTFLCYQQMFQSYVINKYYNKYQVLNVISSALQPITHKECLHRLHPPTSNANLGVEIGYACQHRVEHRAHRSGGHNHGDRNRGRHRGDRTSGDHRPQGEAWPQGQA